MTLHRHLKLKNTSGETVKVLNEDLELTLSVDKLYYCAYNVIMHCKVTNGVHDFILPISSTSLFHAICSYGVSDAKLMCKVRLTSGIGYFNITYETHPYFNGALKYLEFKESMKKMPLKVGGIYINTYSKRIYLGKFNYQEDKEDKIREVYVFIDYNRHMADNKDLTLRENLAVIESCLNQSGTYRQYTISITFNKPKLTTDGVVLYNDMTDDNMDDFIERIASSVVTSLKISPDVSNIKGVVREDKVVD